METSPVINRSISPNFFLRSLTIPLQSESDRIEDDESENTEVYHSSTSPPISSILATTSNTHWPPRKESTFRILSLKSLPPFLADVFCANKYFYTRIVLFILGLIWTLMWIKYTDHSLSNDALLSKGNLTPAALAQSSSFPAPIVISPPSPLIPATITSSSLANDEIGPTDVVYTFVNGSDHKWEQQIKLYNRKYQQNKYRDWNELKYSLRSVDLNLNWIRNIYIVVSNETQIPQWLNLSHSKIKIIYHSEIFDDVENTLPTFNSNVIESYLHRIPGLADNYIYMNNDLFLGKKVKPSDFMTKTHYMKYSDYLLGYSISCIIQIRKAHQIKLENFWNNSTYYSDCFKEPFFMDSMISKHYFQQSFTHWYMHIPHMFNKEMMFRLEETISPLLNLSRKNRFRNKQTDINILMQYEAMIQSIKWKEIKTIIVSQMSKLKHNELYTYVVFMNEDREGFYDKLTQKINLYQPKFIGIDDDLKTPSKKIINFHEKKLASLFEKYWPTKAEWEI